MQPDSLIPQPYNPLTLDRFAYAQNNPILYNDPSCHDVGCGGRNAGSCASVTGEFLSINFSLGSGTKLIVNGSIDLVVTRKNAAIFYSPQVPHAATKSDPPLPLVTDWYLAGPSGRNNPPKEYYIYNDNQIISPQVGISFEAGPMSGSSLEDFGAEAYQGPFTYIGGSIGVPPIPFSITGDHFVSNDPRTGKVNNSIKGNGGGASFGFPPIEIHKTVKDSQLISGTFNPDWYFTLNPNSVLR